MENINDYKKNIFDSILDKYSEAAISEKQRIKSERAEFVSFFVENLKNKEGKHFPKSMIAIKLSHIPTKDLSYMISIFKDTTNRRGIDAANKEFWWSIKA